ncbi:MAG: TATA-box-binding protein [Methanomassiliicoccales archaeon]|nr:MAG: TATA-box-binding protein [Methanomassiliicoccales archaeon]
MKNIRIQNLVATLQIAENLNLEYINQITSGMKYNPVIFPGLIYRLKELGTTLLLFKSGQVVCTGAKYNEDINRSIKTLIKVLKGANLEVFKNPNITIQNIVATYNLDVRLDLNEVAIGLGLENIEYEPEQFPGLVYRIVEPRTVILLFQSGKVICTGAKQIEDIELAINKLKDELHTYLENKGSEYKREDIHLDYNSH